MGDTVMSFVDYYPFGLQMPGRVYVSGSETREGFTGHELEPETGDYYAGARYYLPELGRWASVDPAGQHPSPYLYSSNNPVLFSDPDGRLDSPIYDQDGNLLGTDDEGLQGRAIVMRSENFRQGMSHKEALRHNLGSAGFASEEAQPRYSDTQRSLSSRPDYNGRLTLREAVDWYNSGDGGSLFIDARKINLSPLTMEDVDAAASNGGYINLAKAELDSHFNTGLVYGTIKITTPVNWREMNGTHFPIRLGGVSANREPNYLDRYDFPAGSRLGRMADLLGRGTPTPCNIFCVPCFAQLPKPGLGR